MSAYRCIVNSCLIAIILTGSIVLDYLWERFFKDAKKTKRYAYVKTFVACFLLIVVWLQALIQNHKDVKADRDMDYFKDQLKLANTSLTNATLTIKGLNDGGGSYAEPTFGFGAGSNTLSVSVGVAGEYPLHSVNLKVLNETKHIRAEITNAPIIPPSETVFERYLGDLSQHWWNILPPLCSTELDPNITNYVRVDINAVNGFSWQIYDVAKVSNGWSINLHYRYRRIQDVVTIEPTNFGNALMVY